MTDTSRIRCHAASSTASEGAAAAEEICQGSSAALDGPPEFLWLFVSSSRRAQIDSLVDELTRRLPGCRILGCVGESLVCGRREWESDEGVAALAMTLGGGRAVTFPLQYEQTADGGGFLGWPDTLEPWGDSSSLILLGDPYSFPADLLLERLGEDAPGVPVLGGMASGEGPNRCTVFSEQGPANHGAVLAQLTGVSVVPLVSQGCRPIGEPLVITRCERNVIFQLGGHPALAQLERIWSELPNRDRQLAQRGLHLGRVVDERLPRFEAGDFLVRNLMGLDRENQAVVAGEYYRAGQTVQFHVRDHETATADLQLALARCRQAAAARGTTIRGGLLFTCNGRGLRLFPEADHDARAVSEGTGAEALAGFFAQGEIGPVGGRNFLHGFTASAALFTDAP